MCNVLWPGLDKVRHFLLGRSLLHLRQMSHKDRIFSLTVFFSTVASRRFSSKYYDNVRDQKITQEIFTQAKVTAYFILLNNSR